MIINNAPLTYLYPDTIKTYLSRKHLFFGRQSGCYSNTTSTVVRTLTVLSSTTGKINRISNHFWHRLRHEYVVNLRETQWASKLNLLVRFNKTREIFASVTRVLSILLTTASTGAILKSVYQRFHIRFRPSAMGRDKLSAAISQLMSKCL